MVKNSFIIACLLPAISCSSIPSAGEAKISYQTTSSPWPTQAMCLNEVSQHGVAKEVLMGKTRTVVIAGGDRAISDESWGSYKPSLGNQKNSTRHLLFTRSCFIRSPDAPSDCEGDACREIRELDGYTWVALSNVLAADCVPNEAACDGTTVKPGGLLVVVTQKCHQLQFEGETIFLDGPNGERAVMHATSDGVPTTDVSLPAGWTLRRETLTSPLLVEPFGGDGECFYNIIRDSKLQSYHQIKYASSIYP